MATSDIKWPQKSFHSFSNEIPMKKPPTIYDLTMEMTIGRKREVLFLQLYIIQEISKFKLLSFLSLSFFTYKNNNLLLLLIKSLSL